MTRNTIVTFPERMAHGASNKRSEKLANLRRSVIPIQSETVSSMLDHWRALSLKDKLAVAKGIGSEIEGVEAKRSVERQAEMSLGGEHEHK